MCWRSGIIAALAAVTFLVPLRSMALTVEFPSPDNRKVEQAEVSKLERDVRYGWLPTTLLDAAKAIVEFQDGDPDSQSNVGMLVLDVGIQSLRATVFFPAGHATRFETLEWYVNTEGDGQQSRRRLRVLENGVILRRFSGLLRGEHPSFGLLSVRIPLMGGATLDALIRFNELQDAERERKSVASDLNSVVPYLLPPATDVTVLEWLYELVIDQHPQARTTDGCREPPKWVAVEPSAETGGSGRVSVEAHALWWSGFVDQRTAYRIIKCMVLLDLAPEGVPISIDNIILRSVYYAVATDEIIKLWRKGGKKRPPLFFRAVGFVNSPAGVGFMHLRKGLRDSGLYGAMVIRLFRSQGVILGSAGACESFLDSISSELFDFNRGVMRRLAAPEGSGLFDPLQLGESIRGGLEFDLRMVLAEQSVLETILKRGPQENCDDKTLTELAMLSLERIPLWFLASELQKETAKNVRQLVKSLEHKDSKRKFDRFKFGRDYIFDQSFSNYWWRVAVAYAYVLVLDRLYNDQSLSDFEPGDLSDQYIALLSDALSKAPNAEEKKLSAKARQLRELVLSNGSSASGTTGLGTSGDVVSLSEALRLLRFPPETFPTCEEALPVVVGSVSWQDRLETLAMPRHAGTLADLYELSKINANLNLDRLTDGQKVPLCKALSDRRHNVDCVLDASKARKCETPRATGALSGGLIMKFNSGGASATDSLSRSRVDSREVWPFLADEILKRRAEKELDPEELAKAAIERRSDFARKIFLTRKIRDAGQSVLREFGLRFELVEKDLACAEGRPLQKRDVKCQWGHLDRVEEADSTEMSRALDAAASPENGRLRLQEIEHLESVIADVTQTAVVTAPAPYPHPPNPFPEERIGGQTDTSGRPMQESSGMVFDWIQDDAGEGWEGRAYFRQPEAPGSDSWTSWALGLTVRNAVRGPDGSYSAPSGGRNNMSVNVNEARAFLGRMFMFPELFSEADIDYSVRADLSQIEMKVVPRILGYKLSEFAVDIVKDGRPQSLDDIMNGIMNGIDYSIKDSADESMTGFLKRLEFSLSIPVGERKDTQIKVGLKALTPGVQLEGLPKIGNPESWTDANLKVSLAPEMQLSIRSSNVGASEPDEKCSFNRSVNVVHILKPRFALDSNGLHFVSAGENGASVAECLDAVLAGALKLEERLCDQGGWDKESCPIRHIRLTVRFGFSGSGQAPAPHLDLGISASLVLRLPGASDLTCLVGINPRVRLRAGESFGDQLLRKAVAEARQQASALKENFTDCARSLAAGTISKKVEEWAKDREFDLLGTKLKITKVDPKNNPIIHIDVSATAAGAEQGSEIRRLIIDYSGAKPRFSLEDLNADSSRNLASAILATIKEKVRELFQRDPDELVRIANAEVGEASGDLYFVADVTLFGIPYLDEIDLGRIHFTAGDLADPAKTKEVIEEILLKAISNRIGQALEDEIQLPYAGKLVIGKDAVSLDSPEESRESRSGNSFAKKLESGRIEVGSQQFNDDWRVLSVKGDLQIWQDFGTEVKLQVGLPSMHTALSAGFGDAQLKALGDRVADLIPFGGDSLELIAPTFRELKPGSGRYGIVFGGKFSWPPEEESALVQFLAKEVILSQTGLSLAGQIGGSITAPVVVPGVQGLVLTKAGLNYFPGVNGGKQGIVINGTLAPGVTPNEHQGRLLRLDAQLDLTDISRLALSMNGKLVAASSAPLLTAQGELKLKDAVFCFRVLTPEFLDKTIGLDADMSAWAGLVNKECGESNAVSFGMLSALGVFGAELLEAEVSADFGDTPAFRAKAGVDTPIGSGKAKVETALDFSRASFSAGVGVDLFRVWPLLAAEVEANDDAVGGRLSVFGSEIAVFAPSVDQLSKWQLRSALSAHFGVKPSELERLNPGDPEGSGLVGVVTVNEDGTVEFEKLEPMPEQPEIAAPDIENSGHVVPEPAPVIPADPLSDPVDSEKVAPDPRQESTLYCHRVESGADRFVIVRDSGSAQDPKEFAPEIEENAATFGWNPDDNDDHALCSFKREWSTGRNWPLKESWNELRTEHVPKYSGVCDQGSGRPWLELALREPHSGSLADASIVCGDGYRVGMHMFTANDDRIGALILCPPGKPDDHKAQACDDNADSWFEFEPPNECDVKRAIDPGYCLHEFARSGILNRDLQLVPVQLQLPGGETPRLDVLLERNMKTGDHSLAVIAESPDGLHWIGHVADADIRRIVLDDLKANACGEEQDGKPLQGVQSCWTGAILAQWWSVADAAIGHVNLSRPIAVVSRKVDGSMQLAWTTGQRVRWAGTVELQDPGIDDIHWSWEPSGPGKGVRTHAVRARTESPSFPRSTIVLRTVLSALPPLLKDSNATHTDVVLVRDAAYHLDFMSFFPRHPPDGPGDIRILASPIDGESDEFGPPGPDDWPIELCGDGKKMEEAIRSAHFATVEDHGLKSNTQVDRFRLRNWAGGPEVARRSFRFAVDPLDVLIRGDEFQCIHDAKGAQR